MLNWSATIDYFALYYIIHLLVQEQGEMRFVYGIGESLSKSGLASHRRFSFPIVNFFGICFVKCNKYITFAT